MIIRTWTSTVTPDDADNYLAHLIATGAARRSSHVDGLGQCQAWPRWGRGRIRSHVEDDLAEWSPVFDEVVGLGRVDERIAGMQQHRELAGLDQCCQLGQAGMVRLDESVPESTWQL